MNPQSIAVAALGLVMTALVGWGLYERADADHWRLQEAERRVELARLREAYVEQATAMKALADRAAATAARAKAALADAERRSETARQQADAVTELMRQPLQGCAPAMHEIRGLLNAPSTE